VASPAAGKRPSSYSTRWVNALSRRSVTGQMSPRIPIRLLAAQSDQRLAALVRDGHERAFEALVQRYRRPLLRYCRHMGLSDARAEDVLQQALLQAWLALARGSDVRELKPWLYRIVHNAAINAVRGASERPHSELTDALRTGTVALGESELERRIAVRDALGDVAALPSMQRQAIFLTAFDGQSHDEVASALGISHGALRGLLYRARSTLRSAAAALTPPPLLAWASGGGGPGGPTAERLAELTASAGGAGMAGLMVKGAVVAVSAGALVTGASVVDRQHQGTSHAAGRHVAAGSASTSGGSSEQGDTAAVAAAAAVAAVPQIGTSGGSKGVQHRVGRRSHGPARTTRQDRREHRGATGGHELEAVSGDARRRAETHSSTRDVQGSSGDSSGGSDSRNGGSSGGSSGDRSVLTATGTSGAGSDGGGSPSTSDDAPQVSTSAGQTTTNQTSTLSYESTVKRDG
jgi:RNA polymerase sigma factor (sigma-70 family)